MHIRHWSEATASAPLPGVAKRILIGPEEGAPFSMRLFELAPGASSPHHRHPWEHEIFILDGEGTALAPGGEEAPLRSGSVLFIRPDEEHRLTNTGRAPLRFLCLVPAGAEA